MDQGPPPEVGLIVQMLRPMCSHPVRITVMDPQSRERLFRTAGVLMKVDEDLLAVECLHPTPALPILAPATLEVLSGPEILFCHTTLSQTPSLRLGRLHLVLPAAVQTEQRRRFPRVDLSVPVHVMVHRTGKALEGELRDLSAGGAAVALDEQVEVGDQIAMVFNLGSGLFFEDLEGAVVRCTPSRSDGWVAGIQFRISDKQRDLVAAFVNRQLQSQMVAP